MAAQSDGKKTAGTVLLVLGIIVLGFGLLFGSIFSGVGIFMKMERENTQKELEEFQNEGAVQVTGEIVSSAEPDDKDHTVVQYDVEGETYEVTYSVVSSNFRPGQKVTLYYSEKDPSLCIFPDLYEDAYGIMYKIFLIVGLAMGGPVLISGLIMLIIGIRFRKKSKLQ